MCGKSGRRQRALLQILGAAAESFARVRPEAASEEQKIHAKMALVKNCVQQHYAEPMRLSELERISGLSRYDPDGSHADRLHGMRPNLPCFYRQDGSAAAYCRPRHAKKAGYRFDSLLMLLFFDLAPLLNNIAQWAAGFFQEKILLFMLFSPNFCSVIVHSERMIDGGFRNVRIRPMGGSDVYPRKIAADTG